MEIKKNMNQLNQPKHDQKLLDPAKHGPLPEFELTTKWLAGGILAALVVLAGGWLIARNNTANEEVAKTDSTEKTADIVPIVQASAAVVAADGEALTVSDQAAGSEVAVANMTIGKTTWVAIRDAKTKWILGARRFESGITTGTVELLRATTAGTAYEVVMYVDNGDNVFDFHTDSLVDGIVSTFTVK